MSEGRGTVIAVCLSDTGGIPKYPQESVTITTASVEGNHHAGETNRDGRPNLRQVTVVGAEAVEAVASELGAEIPHGGLGENVLVRGLGELSELTPGQRLRFEGGVELEVTAQNDPCSNLMVYGNQAVKLFYGCRGLLTVVRATGHISPGEGVSIHPAG